MYLGQFSCVRTAGICVGYGLVGRHCVCKNAVDVEKRRKLPCDVVVSPFRCLVGARRVVHSAFPSSKQPDRRLGQCFGNHLVFVSAPLRYCAPALFPA